MVSLGFKLSCLEDVLWSIELVRLPEEAEQFFFFIQRADGAVFGALTAIHHQRHLSTTARLTRQRK